MEESYKSKATARWNTLLDAYRERLDKLNLTAEDDDEKLRIMYMEFTKPRMFSEMARFEKLSEKEKEVFEIYRIKYSGHYIVIFGPTTMRRTAKVFHDIDI